MALAGAPEIRRGDHACCVFGTDDEQAQLVSRFARDAFARGDRLFYLADMADEDTVVGFVDDAGLDGRALLYAGALQILPSQALNLEDGFDRDRQMAIWDQRVAQARADGFGGLAVAAEMTWSLSWGVDSDVLIEYEAAAGAAFDSNEMSALCQYDSRFFADDVAQHVCRVHPYAVTVHAGGWSADYSRMHVDGGPGAAFSVGGEIDLANVAFLETQLTEHLRDGDASVDCSGVTFVDLAGCRLLRRACAGELGEGRLTLRNVPAVLSRVIDICDLADGGAE